jgi:hypothetical protein
MLPKGEQHQAMFSGSITMSNLQSVLGGAVWITVAAALMMMTFAPAVEEQTPAAAAQLVAQSHAPLPSAAV